MNVEQLRAICLSFPAATESVKWEHDLAFSVGDKMFCVTSFDHPFQCSFKVPDEQFEELCHRTGFTPAPYLARAKWVLVSDEAGLSAAEWHERLNESYRLVKAKISRKQQKELGLL